MAEAENQGGNGGSAGAEASGGSNIESLVQEAVKKATAGLVSNRDEILGEKKKLQEQLDSISKRWEGLDPDAVRNFMSRLENDDEARLIAEGKLDQVIERRTDRLKSDHEKQISKLSEAIEKREQALNTAQSQVKRLMVEGNLRQAAAEMSLVPSAIEDALMHAMSVFKINDEGQLIAEQDGGTLYGKDGKNPLTPAEWLEAMKEKKAHWFPAPVGGGASGGNSRGNSFTLTRAQARDVNVYRNAKAAAEKAGAEVRIVG